jgi:alcohol dehydrogenase YqhD (iron-dependent ADH family)
MFPLKVFYQVARDLTHGKLLTIVQETIWEDNIRRTKQKTLIVFSNEVFQIFG